MSEGDSGYEPLKATLEAYREEHRDINEAWRQLDAKAQGTAAIAGVFLAAAFVFVREINSLKPSLWTRAGLVVAIGCLVTSVALAVVAMRVRQVSAAPLGEPVEQLAEDLMAVADEAERLARMPAFVRDQVAPWKEVNEELRKAIQSKAESVSRAQLWLLAAIGAVAVVTVLVLGGWV